MRKLYKILTIICLFIFIFLNVNFYTNASNRSFIGDYFNKVFDIELTNGNDIFSDNELRLKINNEIINNTEKTYSLYDRFGSQIKFIPYYGEKKIEANLFDKFYTSFVNNEIQFNLSWDYIKSILLNKTKTLSNNIVYEGRNDILSNESILNGYYDPRVYQYSGVHANLGGKTYLSNLLLKIATSITIFVSWISGNGLFNLINELYVNICNLGISDLLQTLSKIFIPLCIIMFLLFLVSYFIKFLAGKNVTFKKLLAYLLSCLISLGLIYSTMTNPTLLSNATNSIIIFIDKIFDSGLNVNADEIVKSDILDNVRTATLWKTAIFEPWCNGMFQDDYEHLYTYFDEDENHIKMYQDNDDIMSESENNEIKFNSVNSTGDISIPLGNNQNVKNWAALAYSCQSIYHIDAINSNININQWPNASTCFHNTNIYIDNFRWLDAKLNISPQYYSNVGTIMNYSNANSYKETFLKEGFNAFFLSIMLFPILILSLRRVRFIIIIVASSIRLWVYSLLNFFLNKDYNLISNLKKVFSPIYDYFWWTLVTYLTIIFYSTIVGKNFIFNLLYLLISIYFMKLKPIRHIREVQEKINNIKFKINNKIQKSGSEFKNNK